MFRQIEIAGVFVSLLVTFGLYAESQRLNRQSARAEFSRVSEDSVRALKTRLNIYQQALNSAAGMLQSAESIEFDDFEALTESMKLKEHLPGINGIGYIEPVTAEETAGLIAEMREKGAPQFKIHPQTDNAEKYIIKYIAPLEPNLQALGLDISFETVRRETADRARETGQPQLTQRLLLVQDDMQTPGFLLLRPVYDRVNNQNSPFRGWVYAPFVGRNLLSNLIPNQDRGYDFEVFDGPEADPETLIFASELQQGTTGAFTSRINVEFFGRPWTIVYQSTRAFDRDFTNHTAHIILIAGILLSAMLAYVLRAMRLHGTSMAEVASLRGRQISAQEDQNRSLIENAVVAVMILDERQTVLFANHAAVDCFGCHRDGMAGQPISEFVTKVDLASDERGFNGTGRTVKGDALYLDVQQNDWVTVEGDRRITMIVRDVTAEVLAVSELAATEKRYDRALEGSDIGVFEIDLKTGASIVSETWRRIMDVGPEEKDPQAVFMKRVHPDDIGRLFTADRKQIVGETGRSVCEYRMDFDGSWRWMRSDAIIVDCAPDGTPSRFLGTQTDVTLSRHARNALEESEERFRTVLEAAPVGMAILDSDAQFISVNTALSELTGYDQEEMVKSITLRQLVPKEDMERMRTTVSEAISSGRQEVYSAEHRILHKEGGERWGLFNITWTFDKNSGSYVFIAQVNDITDKKKIDQIKSEFVSTVSHELRTPLTSIKGALGLIEASGSKNMSTSTKRLIDIAQTNVARLTEIVNDILDLEKISSGEVDFDLTPIDMGKLVQVSVDQMMPFAVTHENRLVVNVPGIPVTVQADRGRLIQVLSNLISNACKYSDNNTDVRVIVERLDDVAITYVQNTGPGVPDSFRSRIFQAFSQADGSDTRAKGGTGLGLNISRQIVQRMGGEIGFESRPNGPTVFWFTCPISQGAGDTMAADAAPMVVDQSKRLRVLHVEDDTDFAEVIRTGLSPFADVSSVTHLRTARIALKAGPLDVIILDWTLPDGDASDLIKEIREAHPFARIVGLSSDASQRQDGNVAVNLLKSKAEMAQIIASVTHRPKQAC